MRFLCIISLLLLSACSKEYATTPQQTQESLDAKGHCSKRVSGQIQAALQQEFKTRLKTSPTIVVNKSGGWCGNGLSYRIERSASTEPTLFLKTDPDHFAEEKSIALDEIKISTLNASIDALAIGSLDPLGCQIVSDGCNDRVVLKIGEETIAYLPESLSGFTHSEAFVTDESFASLLQVLNDLNN